MKRIDIITLFPEMFDSFINQSILKRAQDKKHICIKLHALRDYAEGKRKNVDDMAFGGGAGMVLSPEPLAGCLDKLLSERRYKEVIYMAPDGELLKQPLVNQLSLEGDLILICGRYKGIDQRIRDTYVSREVSIGDYVISGGELAAAVLVDAIARVIPGVLSDESSALCDSFQDNLLDAPVYTRPAEFRGLKVPEVLLSGNQKKIDDWRYEQALVKTKKRRPDLLSD